jgi:hypothetical protein
MSGYPGRRGLSSDIGAVPSKRGLSLDKETVPGGWCLSPDMGAVLLRSGDSRHCEQSEAIQYRGCSVWIASPYRFAMRVALP